MLSPEGSWLGPDLTPVLRAPDPLSPLLGPTWERLFLATGNLHVLFRCVEYLLRTPHLPSSTLQIQCYFLGEALNRSCSSDFAFSNHPVLFLCSINYLDYYSFSVYVLQLACGHREGWDGVSPGHHWIVQHLITYYKGVGSQEHPPFSGSKRAPCPSCCHHCAQLQVAKGHRGSGLRFQALWLLLL